MSDKQTSCPKCLTIYKVSVAQLTVAQGMVCCPKCSMTFNALSHLTTGHTFDTGEERSSNQNDMSMSSNSAFSSPRIDSIHFDLSQSAALSMSTSNLLDIFNLKVEHSNIDLKTYLNNLNYFSTDPIGNYPAMNLADNNPAKPQKSPMYYMLWCVINFSLLALLCFQYLWFNPHILNNSPALGATYNKICLVLNCSSLQERYSLISINKLKVKRVDAQKTQFSGELINYHDTSLPLPDLKVILKVDGEVDSTYQLHANEYLIDSLVGIKRIPKNSPFKFKFSLPVSRKSFNHYSLEIVQP